MKIIRNEQIAIFLLFFGARHSIAAPAATQKKPAQKPLAPQPVAVQPLSVRLAKLKPLYPQFQSLTASTPVDDPFSIISASRVHTLVGNWEGVEKSAADMKSLSPKPGKLTNEDIEEYSIQIMADTGAVAWEIGEKSRAQPLIDKAIEAAKLVAGETPRSEVARRRNVLLKVAKPLVAFNAWEPAKVCLELAGDRAIELSDLIEKDEADPEKYNNLSEMAKKMRKALPASAASTNFSLKIVRLQLQIGDKAGARKTLRGLQEPLKPTAGSLEPGESLRCWEYIDYWTQRAACGDVTEAKQAIAHSLNVARRMGPSDDQTVALQRIVEAQTKFSGLGDPKATVAMSSGSDNVGQLNGLAEVQFLAGDKAGARRTLSQAVNSVRSMNGFSGAIYGSRVGITAAKIGDLTTAKSLAAKTPDFYKPGVLEAIAKAYAGMKNMVAARATLVEAMRSAAKSTDFYDRAQTLTAIAWRQHEFGADADASVSLALADPAARAYKGTNKDYLCANLVAARITVGNITQANAMMKNISSPQMRIYAMSRGILSATGYNKPVALTPFDVGP